MANPISLILGVKEKDVVSRLATMILLRLTRADFDNRSVKFMLMSIMADLEFKKGAFVGVRPYIESNPTMQLRISDSQKTHTKNS